MKKSKLHKCEASQPPLNMKQHYSKFSVDQISILKITSQELSKSKEQNYYMCSQVETLKQQILKLKTQNHALDSQNSFLKQVLAQQQDLINSKIYLDSQRVESKLSHNNNQITHDSQVHDFLETNSSFIKNRHYAKFAAQEVEQPHGEDNDDLDICEYGEQSILIGLQETSKASSSIILSSQTRTRTFQNQPTCSILMKRKNRVEKSKTVFPQKTINFQEEKAISKQNDIMKYLLDNNSMLHRQLKQLKNQLNIITEQNKSLLELVKTKRNQNYSLLEKISDIKNLCNFLHVESGMAKYDEKILFYQSIFKRVNILLTTFGAEV